MGRRAPVPRIDVAPFVVGLGAAAAVPVETDTASVLEAAAEVPDAPDDAEAEVPIAFWRNAENVFPLVGAFTEKTMPALQWLEGFVCLQ